MAGAGVTNLLKIKAERVEGKYLKVGDLFSDQGPEFWSRTLKGTAKPLFLCVNEPEKDDEELVYRLSIEYPQDLDIVTVPSESQGPVVNPFKAPGEE